MKNKYIYFMVIIVLSIIVSLYFTITYLNNNYSSTDRIETSDWKIQSTVHKNISSDLDSIDPDNYDSLTEFISFLNTGSWINLNVDLINETFYIKTVVWDLTSIVKFDKELISDIDLWDSWNIKNQAILDIFNSYKRDGYILWEANNERSWIRILEEHELPPSFRLHNNILNPYVWESFLETKKRLENKINKTNEDNHQLSYLYDYSWDYKKALELKEKAWIKKINYRIEGRVFNLWNNIEWAKVEVLNYTWVESFTNEKWEYILEFETYPLTRLRLRASLNGYSDWYNGTYIVLDYNNQYVEDINFSLHNVDTKKIVKASDISWDKKVIVESTIWNSFEFIEWVLIDKNWKKYNWDFNVEIFEFNRNTPGMENFLTLDNFYELYWYTWNMMITNGMTYLMLTDIEWNELFISKRNPIITRQIVDIDYLLNNKQNGTTLLSKAQLSLILEKSKEEWYPIDNIFLWNRGITWFSPWWVLNRTKWIWENRWIKLLNKDWLKESSYYNID